MGATRRRTVVAVAMLVSLWAGSGWAQALGVVGFPDIVDDLMRAAQGVDLCGFSEVQADTWARLFEHAAEDREAVDFQRILGTTGGGDRLLIVYNGDRFDVVSHFELTDANI